jgi:hypothetical protein
MAQRKPMLDFISEGDWRLADERQRLLAPLAESENGSVEDVDRVARLRKLSRASVYRLLHLFRQHLVTSLLPGSPGRTAGRFILSEPQEKMPKTMTSSGKSFRAGLVSSNSAITPIASSILTRCPKTTAMKWASQRMSGNSRRSEKPQFVQRRTLKSGATMTSRKPGSADLHAILCPHGCN